VIAPDGAADRTVNALFAINLESGEKRQLTYPPSGAFLDADPAVSPDGRSLVFRRDLTPFTGEMYRVALGPALAPAGEPVRLTDRTFSASRPTWTPDSQRVVFSAKGALWSIDPFNPVAPVRLPFVGLDGTQPAISAPMRDGRARLIYVHVFSDTNIWRLDLADAGAPASATPQRVISSTRVDHLPMLSPDGKRLAFFSARSGEFELWVSDLDGSNAAQLTSLKSLPGFARWSPDGQALAFHSDPEGHPDVLTIPANGGKPQIVTPGADGGGYPSFSRDGRFIYYTGPDETTRLHLWRIPATGGPRESLSDIGDVPVESYDGSRVFYLEGAQRRSALWELPLSGGPARKLIDEVFNAAFDVAEQGIYYVEQSAVAGAVPPRAESRLRYYPFATGKTVTVMNNLGALGNGLGITTSRDGRIVFFARIDASADELMLVENFR
jgi:Tol biopolymer transport system component